jgi:hypothetical protein
MESNNTSITNNNNNNNNNTIIIHNNNNNNNTYFYNKHADFLLHCVLISLNDYLFDDTNNFNNISSSQYDSIKNNSINLAQNDTNGLMKKYKIFTTKNFVNTIFSCTKITPELFFMLNILNNITIIILKNNKAYYFGNNNNNVTGYIIADTYKFFTKHYEFKSESYYHIYNPFKCINCASSYKILELQNIAKMLNIPIIIDNKNRLKKDLYDHIKSELMFEF